MWLWYIIGGLPISDYAQDVWIWYTLIWILVDATDFVQRADIVFMWFIRGNRNIYGDFHAVAYRDNWMPGTNCNETTWLEADHTPTHGCLSIHSFRLDVLLHIEFHWMPRAITLPPAHYTRLHITISKNSESNPWLKLVKVFLD